MNFLAHIYLSGENDSVKFGNFIGDSVKGKAYQNFEKEIRTGILLHRKIDSFTDRHPDIKKSARCFRPAYGKFSGVAVDILFDHFLAKDPEHFPDDNLTLFVDDFYRILKMHRRKIPLRARPFIKAFIRRNRLICYKSIDCLHDVFLKMGRYTSMPAESDAALQIIEDNYTKLQNAYQAFFPEVQNYSKSALKSMG